MIEVMQGTPGSGKSAVSVARAILHLCKGGVVACNFSLVEGWAETIVRNKLMYRLLYALRYFLPDAAPRYLYRKATCLHSRFFRVDSLAAIRSINPVMQAVGIYKYTGKYCEGSGLLILDEAQLIFNARKWDKNMDWIEFFTQHRKLGWNVMMIAHTIEMIDAQIRPLAEFESRFRNMQKLRFPVIGLPMSPYPMFIVIKRYAGLGAGASVIHSRALYPLPLWAARLYDSLLVFSAEHWGMDTTARHCGEPPAAPEVARDVGFNAVRRAQLIGPHWDEYLQTVKVKQ
ncbi:MAG: hypothetical protein EG822_12600 [Deltaproteobacteria bacterium]|nr:hypothetical protein [Deltaproteobacteria bacterium]TLN03807.1 MAG: hypothetical protein FDZ73_06385 [bacterium]